MKISHLSLIKISHLILKKNLLLRKNGYDNLKVRFCFFCLVCLMCDPCVPSSFFEKCIQKIKLLQKVVVKKNSKTQIGHSKSNSIPKRLEKVEDRSAKFKKKIEKLNSKTGKIENEKSNDTKCVANFLNVI